MGILDLVFECKFDCGTDLYKSQSGRWLEVGTEIEHKCPNIKPKEESGSGFGYENLTKHEPSQYILDREEWQERVRALEKYVEEIRWKLVKIELN